MRILELMATRRLWTWLLLLAVNGACGSDEPCETGANADGTYTIAIDGACLRQVSASARRDGVWTTDGVQLELEPIAGGALTVVSAEGGVDALQLHIGDARGDRMLQQGYQSWSFSGATWVPDAVTLHEDGAPLFGAPDTGDVFDEEVGVSYGSVVVGNVTGPYLVVGAVSAHVANTGLAATRAGDATELTIVYGTSREPLPAGGDGRVRSERIALLGSDDPNAGLAMLRGHMAAALPANTPPPRRPPAGWFSWNERFEDIDEQYIRDHIAIVATELAPAGMPLVEIDDGWMPRWGDWIDNERFPTGMESLGAEITGAGLVAGVWMAPFLVDINSQTGQTIDPALLVQGADGNPLTHRFSGGANSFYILDGSNPDAMKVATDAVARLAAAGFTFFKFDFLYAGAFPGPRANPVTGVEALRNGMRLLREAIGPDAIINACGVPILPIIGLADSLRVGADTAFVPPHQPRLVDDRVRRAQLRGPRSPVSLGLARRRPGPATRPLR